MTQKYIKELIEEIAKAKKKRKENSLAAYETGMELMFRSKPKYEALKTTFGETEPEFRVLANNLATEVLQCGIDYFKATQNNSGFTGENALEILRSANELALDAQIKSRIEDNIQGVIDWVNNQAMRDSQSKIYNFPSIAFKTAFSFMTCDGHIDENEVALIRKIASESELFGNINVDEELEFLIEVINQMGMGFLKDYFKVLKNATLSQEQELTLVQVAMDTLNADAKIDYNEMKFFRIFRTMMTISDDQIRQRIPSISEEFLETDIFSKAYLDQLFDDYFEHASIPVFSKMLLASKNKYVNPDIAD
ncbi:TerB family tellurite resistance protein [Reichenbachiella agarivorans]|uniref:TerB family tellurite resistance protein n=1 Tax=Reichenbachiella agarivorans TaxID=2979464 RepID=A0ABY6CR34_9BACT|nr:TerB family tellurite resistance protein [Reichenbachiella agarivorans]UXP32981.1 TerB family tellurite resistance protein [Reichenbachiella agarivorans]